MWELTAGLSFSCFCSWKRPPHPPALLGWTRRRRHSVSFTLRSLSPPPCLTGQLGSCQEWPLFFSEGPLHQWSPTFLVQEMDLVEDNFSTDWGGGMVSGQFRHITFIVHLISKVTVHGPKVEDLYSTPFRGFTTSKLDTNMLKQQCLKCHLGTCASPRVSFRGSVRSKDSL